MNVNKKKLADIFGVDVRTITAWQSQGLPLVSGGGKGTESVFDTQLLPFSGMRRGKLILKTKNSVKRSRI